jgi:hypothetical protein
MTVGARRHMGLVWDGKLPYRKTMAAIRFSDSDLDDYIASVSERRGETDKPELRAARRARSRGFKVDPEFIDTKLPRKKGGGASSDGSGRIVT